MVRNHQWYYHLPLPHPCYLQSLSKDDEDDDDKDDDENNDDTDDTSSPVKSTTDDGPDRFSSQL